MEIKALVFEPFYLFFPGRIDFIFVFEPTIPHKKPFICSVRRESLFSVVYERTPKERNLKASQKL